MLMKLGSGLPRMLRTPGGSVVNNDLSHINKGSEDCHSCVLLSASSSSLVRLISTRCFVSWWRYFSFIVVHSNVPRGL